MTLRKRRIILALCVFLFLLAAPVVLLYTNGYRWDSKFQLYKTGGLYVSSPLSGSQIFVNNKLEKETNIMQSGLFLQGLKPGKYSILIAKEGHWPWSKNLQVKAQLVTEARAMLMPKEPNGTILLRENYSPLEISKYEEILKNLNALRQPLKKRATAEEKEARYSRLTPNEKEKLWWNPQENKLWVTWLADSSSLPYYFCDNISCKEMMLILASKFPIKNADFYPKRKDIVIVAVQNGVYALEIDGRGGRLLQPIYKGKDPIFTTYKNDNSIYILDEDNLMEIKLE
jgi:hypothetical protein